MTIFDVVAFKMVTALASSTATAVTASDWESVITAMTGQVSVATIVGVLATVVAACVPFPVCLLYTSPSPRDPKTSRMPSSA